MEAKGVVDTNILVNLHVGEGVHPFLPLQVKNFIKEIKN